MKGRRQYQLADDEPETLVAPPKRSRWERTAWSLLREKILTDEKVRQKYLTPRKGTIEHPDKVAFLAPSGIWGGPGFYFCWYCHTAKALQFKCKCVPSYVGFCWPCMSDECGHQEELIKAWKEKQNR